MFKPLITGFASVAITLLSVTAAVSGAHAQGGPTFPGGEAATFPEVTSYIIGGGDARAGEFPFMVSLQKGGKHLCGGSLIGDLEVLTAEHCVTDITDVKDMTVVIGSNNIANKALGQTRNIKYIDSKVSNDVAVITLDRPVTDILPVEFPTPGTDALLRPGSLATVIGWGNTDPKRWNSPEILQKVDVPLLSQTECKLAFRDSPITLTDADICAGRANVDSCQGDSGGPLFKKIDGVIIQIGVVSRGEGCAQQGKPGVYASTSHKGFLDDLVQIYPEPTGVEKLVLP
ncbi:serine protease [Lysinibacter sp. HNR]|uniref:S1 family serine peptidase n=1 Tax=Lysinibacter sp. HNR TaxID=3031408 RepID=UPI002434B1FD|nr:serine protease [Lysinibacter sp. HNR]WGD37093.1 serine protease [Lysinibacter sp. HNR]